MRDTHLLACTEYLESTWIKTLVTCEHLASTFRSRPKKQEKSSPNRRLTLGFDPPPHFLSSSTTVAPSTTAPLDHLKVGQKNLTWKAKRKKTKSIEKKDLIYLSIYSFIDSFFEKLYFNFNWFLFFLPKKAPPPQLPLFLSAMEQSRAWARGARSARTPRSSCRRPEDDFAWFSVCLSFVCLCLFGVYFFSVAVLVWFICISPRFSASQPWLSLPGGTLRFTFLFPPSLGVLERPRSPGWSCHTRCGPGDQLCLSWRFHCLTTKSTTLLDPPAGGLLGGF